jgi:large-conductance mechanosensitive channel
MKYTKILAIVFVIVAFAIFFLVQPVREKACPLTKLTSPGVTPSLEECANFGGVVKDGECTCPDS